MTFTCTSAVVDRKPRTSGWAVEAVAKTADTSKDTARMLAVMAVVEHVQSIKGSILLQCNADQRNMTDRERFHASMQYGAVDRAPFHEFPGPPGPKPMSGGPPKAATTLSTPASAAISG
jgi:hypothetical protein